MKPQMILAAMAALFAAPLAAQPASAEAEPVEIMVLGTYHFANPGRDLVNVEADNVLAPDRQRELEALADALATFRPTRIVVEREADGPDFALASYRDFGPEMLASRANETVQIGYRLARRLGHENVFGFDEQSGESEPDYFPFGAVRDYAAEHGMSGRIAAIMAEVQGMAERLQADQATQTIPELLIAQNRSEEAARMHGIGYYGLLAIGDGDRQPGAELNAYWFMRNAKMFAKLGLIADPGDRVLVIVGSGHKFWLDHLAELTPGYRRVDPLPYLDRAAASLRD